MSEKWATSDELIWIDQIGRVHEKTRETDEAALLAGYLEGAAHRRDWGDIDRQKVVRYVVRRHANLTTTQETPA